MDQRTEKNIATLLAPTQEMARRFLRAVAVSGILPADVTLKIISGTRTYTEQDELYKQGRTKPGLIVTKAKGGQSNHNFGVAFDIGLFRGADYLESSPLYEKLGPVGESVGLEWGGRWKFTDTPHYELRTGLTVSEMDRRKRSGVPILAGTIYEQKAPTAVKPTEPTKPRPWTIRIPGADPYEVSEGATDEVRFTAEKLGAAVVADAGTREIRIIPIDGK